MGSLATGRRLDTTWPQDSGQHEPSGARNCREGGAFGRDSVRAMRAIAICVIGLVLGTSQPAQGAPARRPVAVLGKVTLGSPSGLDGVRAVIDAVRPGTGATITTELLLTSLTPVSLNGLDLAGPVHVLYVDSRVAQGFTVVARVSDPLLLTADAVSRNGWAVVGPKPLVGLVARWALAALDATAVPPDLVATIYPGAILGRYRKELAAVRKNNSLASAGLPADLVDDYLEMAIGFARDTAELAARIDASGDLVALDLAFVPKPRSRLARFVRVQQPSDFTLLGKLPSAKVVFAGAGRFTMGPYRKGLLELLSKFYGPIAGGKLAPLLGAMMKATTGEFAMAMHADQGAMALDSVYGLKQLGAVDAMLARMLAALIEPQSYTIGPVTTTMQAVAGSTAHGDVTIRAYDTTTTGGPPNPMMPPKTRTQVAAFDSLLLMAANSDATHAIDAARGKRATYQPTTAQRAMFERSRRRKDSMALVMDLAAFSGLGMPLKLPPGSNLVFTIGFADGAAHFNIGLPTSVLRVLGGSP